MKDQDPTYDLTVVARKGAMSVMVTFGDIGIEPTMEMKAESETRVIETFRWAFEKEPTFVTARVRKKK